MACLMPTQIELRVETDLPCSALTGYTVTVGARGEVENRAASTEASMCSDGRLGALVLIPSAERNAELAIKVVGASGIDVSECTAPNYGKGSTTGGCIVARRELRFVEHTSLVLPIALRASCLNVPCESGATCVDGACVPAAVEDPAKCVSDTACTDLALFGGGTSGAGGSGSSGPKRVFVSSATFTGALGGLTGADAKCQSLADDAKLGGVFKAWLSTDAASPSTRFTKVGPWQLIDGSPVADDWAELTSGTLKHAISLDEHGQASSATNPCSFLKSSVWSQTNPDGTFSHANDANPSDPRFDCVDWTGSNALDAITWGDASATDAHWTLYPSCGNFGAQCLKKLAHLYCFEQ